MSRFEEVMDFEHNKYIRSSGKLNNKNIIPIDKDWKMGIQFNQTKALEKTN